MLLPIYLSLGELMEGWQRMAEYMQKIKSSETQFYKPDLASEMLSKLTSGLWMHKLFIVIVLVGHGAQTEFVWPNFGRFMHKTLVDTP